MDTMVLSVPEVAALGKRALYARNWPYGVAGRAADVIEFIEIHYGCGLSSLDEILRREAHFVPIGVRLDWKDGIGIVKCGDSNVLAVGPDSVDLVAGRAKTWGASALWLRGLDKAWMITRSIHRAAASGKATGIVAYWKQESAYHPFGACGIVISTPSSGGADLGIMAFSSVSCLLRALQSVLPLAREISGWSTGSEMSELGALVGMVERPGVSLDRQLKAWRDTGDFVHASRVTHVSHDELVKRDVQARRNGIPVDRDLWSVLIAEGRRILVPETYGESLLPDQAQEHVDRDSAAPL